jgi:hypothetical protein
MLGPAICNHGRVLALKYWDETVRAWLTRRYGIRRVST